MSNEDLKNTYISTEFMIDCPYTQENIDDIRTSALQYSEQLYNKCCKPAFSIYRTLLQMTPEQQENYYNNPDEHYAKFHRYLNKTNRDAIASAYTFVNSLLNNETDDIRMKLQLS